MLNEEVVVFHKELDTLDRIPAHTVEGHQNWGEKGVNITCASTHVRHLSRMDKGAGWNAAAVMGGRTEHSRDHCAGTGHEDGESAC